MCLSKIMISIVVPVYNSEEYLPAALDSLITQTHQNLEIIIVNNGSKGNVNEIFDQYKDMYPKYKWKLVVFEKNQGLYHARLAGWKQATGEYLTTADSDDLISVDFYYQLLKKAVDTNSDVVVADYVNDFENSGKKHYSLNPMELTDICWEGEEALQNFFDFHGGCFNLHAMWIKIFSRSVFEQAKKHMEAVKMPLVLSEDILYSCMIYAFAKRVTNVHHAYYYHAVREGVESSNIAASVEKIMKGFQNQYDVFNEMEKFLARIGCLEKYKDGVEEYRLAFVSVLFSNLKYSQLTKSQKKSVEQKVLKMFDLAEPIYVESPKWLFESRTSPFFDMREAAYARILDPKIKCISFDIFDTLVERPFFRPSDTFCFLSKTFNERKKNILETDFAAYRQQAEVRARKKVQEKFPMYSEVTLREIYDVMVEDGIISQEESEDLLQKEIELEYRFCKRRMVGYELYDFARRCGKKIICISDMYLPADAIRTILLNCGYENIDELFVSSEERVCKYDKRLFKIALKKLNLKAEEVAHFGDNYISDCVVPGEIGIRSDTESTYLSAARELIAGRCGLNYTGCLFDKMFGNQDDPTSPQNYLGNRCLIGVASNKVFSNPYVEFDRGSAFDANPVYLGYFGLGMYVFSVAKWLLDETAAKGYDTIHFIARDGYLIKKAYDILAQKSKKKCPKSNYFYTSRKATMPLMIQVASDIDALMTMIDFRAYTPLKLLEQVRETIDSKQYEKRMELLKQSGILADQKFQDESEWIQFSNVYKNYFFSKKATKMYRAELKNQFSNIIHQNDCTFDAGYSARTESILSGLLGYRIDAYYLFCNTERGFKQAKCAGIDLRTFHTGSAGVSAMKLLESFICTAEGSCEKYVIENGTLSFKLGEPQFDFQTRFILQRIQEESLLFVDDFVETFPDEWEWMIYRDAAHPFIWLMTNSTVFDHGIFLAADFGDAQNSSDNSLFTCWNQLDQFDCEGNHTHASLSPMDAAISFGATWKKYICYALYDRKRLKEEIKGRLSNRPILLGMLKILYSVPRGIYHIFK